MTTNQITALHAASRLVQPQFDAHDVRYDFHPVEHNSTVVFTLAGVLLTQFRADQRADKLECRREVRENTGRSYENRRDAYATFLSHLYQLEGVARKWNEHEQGELPEDSLESLVEPFALIRIYGTTAANEAAEKLREWLVVDVFGPRPENHEYERANLEENFLHAVRNDFAIPDVLSLNS